MGHRAGIGVPPERCRACVADATGPTTRAGPAAPRRAPSPPGPDRRRRCRRPRASRGRGSGFSASSGCRWRGAGWQPGRSRPRAPAAARTERARRARRLCTGVRVAGLAVEPPGTRHLRAAVKTVPAETDGKDARGLAPLMVDAGAIDGLVPRGASRVAAGASLIAPRSSGRCRGRAPPRAKRHGAGTGLRGVPARLWAEGWPDDGPLLRGPRPRAGGRALGALGARRGLAGGPQGAWRAAAGAGEAPSPPGPRGCTDQAADDRAGRRGDRGAHLQGSDRRSCTLPLLASRRARVSARGPESTPRARPTRPAASPRSGMAAFGPFATRRPTSS